MQRCMLGVLMVLLAGCPSQEASRAPAEDDARVAGFPEAHISLDEGEGGCMTEPNERSEAEWQAMLTPEQYFVMRQQGTEHAFTGAYYATKEPGVYICAGCEQELFSSETKFDSGTGWPSFTEPSDSDRVATRIDRSHGMVRTEVVCSRCGSHLGHVFEDGPGPTGLRYCMNSVSLRHVPSDAGSESD